MQGTTMERSKLQALAAELAKDIKTEADLNALSRELLKLTIETALGAELTEHLGYDNHGDSKLVKGDARNGATPKRLKKSAWRGRDSASARQGQLVRASAAA